MIRDPYYSRPEVSNSDLHWLQCKLGIEKELKYDLEAAYRFGRLLDGLITERHKVNYFKLIFDGEKFTRDEFMLAEEMAKWFWRDDFCRLLAKNSEMQKVVTKNNFQIEHDGHIFTVDGRCKFDLHALARLAITGDIKSTTATTHKQFVDACYHFHYPRQRAWYMDLAGSNKDMIIGISKLNKGVFKVPVTRDSEMYKVGRRDYEKLCFQWHVFFGDLERTVVKEYSGSVLEPAAPIIEKMLNMYR